MQELKQISLSGIIPDPDQPRKEFDEEALNDLAASIKAAGLIQPIRVRQADNHSPADFMIIAGERRWRACAIAGLETIDAVVVSGEDLLRPDVIYAHQLSENLHRADLNPVERAEFIDARIKQLKADGVGNAVEVAAEELGVSTSWISKNTAILKYAPEVRALAKDGRLKDYGALKKIDALKGERKQAAIQAVERGEFVAKEFFSRKRYDGKKKTAEQGDAPVSLAKLEKKPAEPVFTLKAKRNEWIGLMERTGYSSMLDKVDAGWRSVDKVTAETYTKNMLTWITESA